MPKGELKRLHVCVPNYRGLIEGQHACSMYGFFHLLGQMNQHPQYVHPTHTIVSTARQTCVDIALSDPHCSHVVFIDDDMVFGPEQFAALMNETLEHDLDFLSALAFSNSYPTKPCIFGNHPDFPEWGDTPWWHIVTDYPKDQRFEVAASGFGMALISRRLLEGLSGVAAFEPPKGFNHAFMFQMEGVRNEDVAFCFNARKAGFKIWCDSRVKIGHISKDRPLIDENVYTGQRDALTYSNNVPECGFNGNGLTLHFKAREISDDGKILLASETAHA